MMMVKDKVANLFTENWKLLLPSLAIFDNAEARKEESDEIHPKTTWTGFRLNRMKMMIIDYILNVLFAHVYQYTHVQTAHTSYN